MISGYLYCPCCHFKTGGPGAEPYFNCPNTTNHEQHILLKQLDDLPVIDKSETNPYLRFKNFFLSYRWAEDNGNRYDQTISELSTRFLELDGKDLKFTPLTKESRLAEKLGLKESLWIKNETGQIGGSHKIRHLIGTWVYLSTSSPGNKTPLAIYSCGNAALAASHVARAGHHKLKVFLPDQANPEVIRAIQANGAEVITCPRQKGTTGDPSYQAFQEAIKHGDRPFSCSGPDNWSNTEGGQTLLLEVWDQLNHTLPERIFIQVGGGALASSAIQSIRETLKPGTKSPQIFAVQPQSSFPFVRTYFALLKTLCQRNGQEMSLKDEEPATIFHYSRQFVREYETLARKITDHYKEWNVDGLLQEACRSMRWNRVWEWNPPEGPQSMAHGILDDITYDWFSIVKGMFESGGWPIIATEKDLAQAHGLAQQFTNIPADATGTAGLAGLLVYQSLFPKENRPTRSTLLLFTGLERGAEI